MWCTWRLFVRSGDDGWIGRCIAAFTYYKNTNHWLYLVTSVCWNPWLNRNFYEGGNRSLTRFWCPTDLFQNPDDIIYLIQTWNNNNELQSVCDMIRTNRIEVIISSDYRSSRVARVRDDKNKERQCIACCDVFLAISSHCMRTPTKNPLVRLTHANNYKYTHEWIL